MMIYAGIAVAAPYGQFGIPTAASDIYSAALCHIDACAVAAGYCVVFTHNVDSWRCIIGYIESISATRSYVGIFQINGWISSDDTDRLFAFSAYDIGTVVAVVAPRLH